MRIIKFRIKNYRAIQDSGDCYLASAVTVLAGKNESGKTSILEALEDFDVDRPIRDIARPLDDDDALPEVTITFELSAADIKELIGDTMKVPGKQQPIQINLAKTYPQQYSIGDESLSMLGIKTVEMESVDEAGASSVQLTREVVVERLLEHVPNFILFSSFEDVFPSKIPLAEARNNALLQDFDIISDLKLDLIETGQDTQKKRHKQQLNVRMNDEYKRYWSQDDTRLSVDWDTPYLMFWIEEDGHYYPPEMRSKGKQWHLAFYVRVTARAKEGVDNVLLIDEPGLFLHATAQKDILRKLEDSAKHAPVIFATHSPYLLEPDKFDWIRLVTRDSKRGTKVENKIHKVSDKESLTPILTAIGLELTAGIASIDKQQNVVVEGPSDWYYLQALKELLGEKDVNFVFGGGAGNMPMVGTILSGWGCRVLYLYDSDKGKRDAEKSIDRNWLIADAEILSPTDADNEAIEDLFSTEDFKVFVLDEPAKTYSSKNSEYVKRVKSDKVLISKLFLERCRSGEVTLSKETKASAKALFARLAKAFKQELGG